MQNHERIFLARPRKLEKNGENSYFDSDYPHKLFELRKLILEGIEYAELDSRYKHDPTIFDEKPTKTPIIPACLYSQYEFNIADPRIRPRIKPPETIFSNDRSSISNSIRPTMKQYDIERTQNKGIDRPDINERVELSDFCTNQELYIQILDAPIQSSCSRTNLVQIPISKTQDATESSRKRQTTSTSDHLTKRQKVKLSDCVKTERCYFWPNCFYPDEACHFIHPAGTCPNFLSCLQGDRCTRIHPNCPTDANCKNADCRYFHYIRKPVCRFNPTCTNISCLYWHPDH